MLKRVGDAADATRTLQLHPNDFIVMPPATVHMFFKNSEIAFLKHCPYASSDLY